MSGVTRLDKTPRGQCPVCRGVASVACGFCDGRGQVPTITLAPDDFDEMAMKMTGTDTIEDAERALAMGPKAWRERAV